MQSQTCFYSFGGKQLDCNLQYLFHKGSERRGRVYEITCLLTAFEPLKWLVMLSESAMRRRQWSVIGSKTIHIMHPWVVFIWQATELFSDISEAMHCILVKAVGWNRLLFIIFSGKTIHNVTDVIVHLILWHFDTQKCMYSVAWYTNCLLQIHSDPLPMAAAIVCDARLVLRHEVYK